MELARFESMLRLRNDPYEFINSHSNLKRILGIPVAFSRCSTGLTMNVRVAEAAIEGKIFEAGKCKTHEVANGDEP